MNAIQKRQNTDAKNVEEPFGLDLSHFTPAEQLVAKLALARKGRGGLEVRTNSLLINALIELDSPSQYVDALNQLTRAEKVLTHYENNVYRELTKTLGISSQREEEIITWVYEHETNL